VKHPEPETVALDLACAECGRSPRRGVSRFATTTLIKLQCWSFVTRTETSGPSVIGTKTWC
jgi:hypothetical protein